MISVKKFLFIISSLLFLHLLLASTVHAGGSNVMLFSANGGVAGGKGVNVIVTVFDPYKNKLDWPELSKYSHDAAGYEPIGVKDLELELEFVNPQDTQYCKTVDGNKTNEYGQIRVTCYSSNEGEFTVKTKFTSDKPLYEGGPDAKGSEFTLAIQFYPKSNSPDKLPIVISKETSQTAKTVDPSPSSVPSDSATTNKLIEVEKENQNQKAQIEELMKSVKEQKQEVSRLTMIIQKIQAFFGNIFK
jgi:hypothetical protein